jgi:hypothetical protein
MSPPHSAIAEAPETGNLVQSPAVALAVAAGLGVVFGVLRSLLGIAGGEVVIPTLVLLFGVNIKLAGTASQIISLPTVAVGLWRYHRAGLLGAPADWLETVVPMGLASEGLSPGGSLVIRPFRRGRTRRSASQASARAVARPLSTGFAGRPSRNRSAR